MKRDIFTDLTLWKESAQRKPLILQGARQVGKTHALRQFGRTHYQDVAYFNFESSPQLHELFVADLDTSRLLELLSAVRGQKILPHKTLIIFDEIQASALALNSLKYFAENAASYHIAAAGSLLGIKMGQDRSFPVGKVNFLHLRPMSFFEFVDAVMPDAPGSMLRDKRNVTALPELFHERFLHLLRFYFVIGGMPEAVAAYAESQDLVLVRQIQKEILASYQRDFNKYADGTDAIRIQRVWETLPMQLARENKKFKYGDIKKGGRAAEFEVALHWLEGASLIRRVLHLDAVKRPFMAYADASKFKLFALDTGLLAAQINLSAQAFLGNDQIFSEFSGAFTENYVAQELIAQNMDLYYWTSGSEAEIDFIFENDNGFFPVEVKAGISRRKKSLRVFSDKFQPTKALRTTARNFREDGGILNVPLYAVSLLPRFASCN